jgi:hypothetical protein
MEVSCQLHAPAVSLSGKEPPSQCPLDRKLDGPQSRSGRYGEEKNLASTGNRTPSVQLLDIPTELSPHNGYIGSIGFQIKSSEQHSKYVLRNLTYTTLVASGLKQVDRGTDLPKMCSLFIHYVQRTLNSRLQMPYLLLLDCLRFCSS